jgi:hypothetical protein
MIPGRMTCYPGWKREYYGYLSSEATGQTSSDYICVEYILFILDSINIATAYSCCVADFWVVRETKHTSWTTISIILLSSSIS